MLRKNGASSNSATNAFPTLRISCSPERGGGPEIQTMLADETEPLTVAAAAAANVASASAEADRKSVWEDHSWRLDARRRHLERAPRALRSGGQVTTEGAKFRA